MLAEIAAGAGMDGAKVAARLASDEDRREVSGEIASAQQIGVTGVPTFIIGSRYGVVGAQAPETLAKAFAEAAEALAAEGANPQS